jgi:hypothetical protein
MEEILLFIEEQQNWIYTLMALLAAVYLRVAWRAYQDLRRAVFGLERERATTRLVRAGAMLALLIAGLVATFVVATFAGPAIPSSARPTALPTVSLLTTPLPVQPPAEGGFNTATPFSLDVGEGAGCTNPNATILSPEEGQALTGVVEITGTADVPNFAFYKVEYREFGGEWLTISAGTERVCDGDCEISDLLGTWDTSLVRPGEYGLRLVVTDTAGNAPLPCVIQVRVLPSP